MTPTSTLQLSTPALLVDEDAFNHNLTTMSAAHPGAALRPHIKAFKSTAVARRLADAGHTNFTCATIREMEGMAAAGLGDDLLLANEVLDASRLGALTDTARVTVAVDSAETIAAAVTGGVREVLIDVNVGLPRCGCDPAQAGALADLARQSGLEVRGVMGYEGHLMDWTDRDKQARGVQRAMDLLLAAHGDVGGDIISAGGTGTFDLNTAANEIQAGSYLFMDTHYSRVDLPFQQALSVLATVISVNTSDGFAVLNAGLKSLAMDHGNPTTDDGEVFFCSDEHTTWAPSDVNNVSVGDHVHLRPAHVDPTIAKHEQMWLVSGQQVLDCWPIDLRHW